MAKFTETLAARTDLHLARKLWHMAMGVMMFALYDAVLDRTAALWILGAAFTAICGAEVLRFRAPAFNAFLVRHFHLIIRGHEVTSVSGIPAYIAGVGLAVALFPKPVALAAILCLAFGDPVASLVGIRYGRLGPRLFNGKSLMGTAAAAGICSLVCGVFFLGLGLELAPWVAMTLVAGLVAAAAEALPLDIDDNFLIPLASGWAVGLTYLLVG